MFLKRIVDIATGKYAFAISVGYKVVFCAAYLLKAESQGDSATAICSCAVLILVDILWYGGIWMLRSFDLKNKLKFEFC